MIEAMACGTPVIAWRNGSVPEVIEEGVSGFVVDSVKEAVQAVGRVANLSRYRCRSVFEERFDAARMARDYLEVYRRLVHAGPNRALPRADHRLQPALSLAGRTYPPGALPRVNSPALEADGTDAGPVRVLTGKR